MFQDIAKCPQGEKFVPDWTSALELTVWSKVNYLISMGSSLHRDQTHVPALAGEFFTSEAPGSPSEAYRKD